MSTVIKWRVYCNTDSKWVEGYLTEGISPNVCFENNTHNINVNSYQILETITETQKKDVKGRLLTNTGTYTQFGDQRISMLNPLFHNYALYNIINPQLYTCLTDTGGTITGNSNGTEIDLNISSSIGSYAVLRSKKVIKYRPGYNVVSRWNVVFTTPVTNMLQFGGMGNNGSDIYFCYSGTDFGVRYSTGGSVDKRKLTITTSETSSVNATVVLNGVSFTVPLTNAGGNTAFTAFEIAKYSYTGWNTEAVDNTVIFIAKNVGLKSNSFSYSSAGNSVATFIQLKVGSSLTTVFVNRADWNGDSDMITALDPLKRNMYSINYSWYGSGNMIFEVFNPDNQKYETVHTIQFANSQLEPSLTQPNMYLQQGIASLGSTTASGIRVAGGFAAVEGNYKIEVPIYGIHNSRSIAANTETVILLIKGRQQINNFINNSEPLIRNLSISTEGAKPVVIKIIKNPTSLSSNTTSDYVKWNYIKETESITIYDTNCLTRTGGIVLSTHYMSNSGGQYIDLTNREIVINQYDIIAITAQSVNISDIHVAVTIVEDY